MDWRCDNLQPTPPNPNSPILRTISARDRPTRDGYAANADVSALSFFGNRAIPLTMYADACVITIIRVGPYEYSSFESSRVLCEANQIAALQRVAALRIQSVSEPRPLRNACLLRMATFRLCEHPCR